MSKKVRTLLRVSSRQQLHDNDIPVQRAEAAQYIKSHPDWVFDREYIEKAVSAYKNGVGEREVLQEILSDAKAHQFDILLAYMSDRIGRQEEYSFYVAALNQIGIEVWTIKDGQLKTQEHIDKLLNYIRFWQNEGESRKTGMRVRDTQQELARAGKFVGGKAPYGYRLVPSGQISNHGRMLKKREIVKEQAQVVKRVYHLAVFNGMGYEKIARALNEQRIPAIESGEWKASTIASILKNPVYMGYPCINKRVSHGRLVRQSRENWIYAREQVKELVIIQPKLWEKAQEIREARNKKFHESSEGLSAMYEEQHKIPFSTRGRLVLIGLAFCGYCGAKLKNGSYCNHWETKSGEKRTAFTGRYICPKKCAGRSCYSQKYLETAVLSTVESCLGRLKPIDVTADLQKMKAQQNAEALKELKAACREQKMLRQDIETLEGKLPEAIRGDFYFSAEKLSSLIKEKEQELDRAGRAAAAAEGKLARMNQQLSEMEKAALQATDWKEEFRNADTATKRMLLSAIIDRIEVKDGDIKIKFKVRPEGLAYGEADTAGRPKGHETIDFAVPE